MIEGPGTPAIIKKTEAQLEEQSRLDAIKRQEGLDTFINDMPPLPALPPPTGAMNTPASDSGLAGTNNTGPSILSTAPVGTLAQAQATTPNSAGAGAAAVGAGLAGAAAPAKQRCVISTPGKVISEQLNKALGAGQDQLVAADEINEVISALIGQLANQALMGTAGLLGLTPRTGYTAGGYGSGSYVDEMVEQTRRSAGSFIADGYNQLAEKLKLQEDYNAMAVEYLPRLLTVINNPLVTADVRDRARISYDDAITVKDTTAIHITKIKPLVVEFETLQRELSGGTVTEARKQAIISRQTQIISEGGTYRAYTEERMRASYREWSDITRI